MVAMLGTIANNGTYVEPRVVKQIINSQTGEKRDIEIVTKENAISKETAKNVLSMMEIVVAEGTGKNEEKYRKLFKRAWEYRKKAFK